MASSTTGCCYLLELPPELRVIIYDFCFNHCSRLPKGRTNKDEEEKVVAKYLIKDWVRLEKQRAGSELLSTSRHILLEAIPIYQKALRNKISLLKQAYDEYEEKMRPTGGGLGVLFCDDTNEVIDDLWRKAVLMEQKLADWEDADKTIDEIVKQQRAVAKAIRREV
jgi:hypothetical protein